MLVLAIGDWQHADSPLGLHWCLLLLLVQQLLLPLPGRHAADLLPPALLFHYV
jgi:hypothetical protein